MPDGSFDCILQINFDIDDLPSNLNEEDIVILHFNEELSKYVEVLSVLDVDNNIIITDTYIHEFSRFALGKITHAEVEYAFPQEGWYFVSLPVNPENHALSILFPSSIGAYHWDAISESYNEVSELQYGKGYWLAIPSDTTVQVGGSPVYEYNLHFSEQGWYQIGSIFNGTEFLNPADEPDGMVLTPAFGYNPSTSTYYQTTVFEEKNGYWVAVFGECDLTVSDDHGLMKVNPEINNQRWADFQAMFGKEPPPPPDSFECGEKEISQIPTEFKLEQNYPNPFNPFTTIEYHLASDSHVELIIYNVLGQVVRKLLNKDQTAGVYVIEWDGTSDNGDFIGSGIFLLQMMTADKKFHRKLLLIN